MTKWHNESGRPLSSMSWLLAHHAAKLPERTQFASSLLETKTKKIVDLGCGPGLWLDIFDKLADPDCEFIGIDSDEKTIIEAQKIAKNWKRKSTFLVDDITQSENIPEADLMLAFNIFPYIKEPDIFLETVRVKLAINGRLSVRQYDGATIRFGPMEHTNRISMDNSLYASAVGTKSFHHYDLDRVFEMLQRSSYSQKKIDFELFRRIAPYPDEFFEYYRNTIEWTLGYISESAGEELENWYRKFILDSNSNPSYFVEVDLVAKLLK